MITVGIVEHDNIIQKQLWNYLCRYGSENHMEIFVEKFENTQRLLDNYNSRFDILFINPEIMYSDTMSLAEKVRELDEQVVILLIADTTAYAVRGYAAEALDYIMKPVGYETLRNTLEKAIYRIRCRKLPHILIHVQSGVMKLAPADIFYVESEGHYLTYFTKQGTIKSRSKMIEAEEALLPYGFLRINKCYIVNRQYIEGVHMEFCQVNGKQLLVSRNRKKELLYSYCQASGE